MGEITLEQIGMLVAFMVALITGISYLVKQLKAFMTQLLKDQLDSIDERLDSLKERLDEVDMESCKNFLVKVLADVEQGNQMTEIEKERFWEEYQHYIKSGGNSYIRHKVETMVSDGKI